jgi:hypothetical protein
MPRAQQAVALALRACAAGDRLWSASTMSLETHEEPRRARTLLLGRRRRSDWMMRVILLALALGACSQAPTPPGGPKPAPAGALKPGMTERQVVEAGNNRVPDSVVQRTCGNETAAPSPCMIYVYERAPSESRCNPKLSIVFEKVGGRWLVTQWL